MSLTYQGTGGPMLWRVLDALDGVMAGLDSEPFRRNAQTLDQWTRSKTPLTPNTATPRAHLEYSMAFRSVTPTGAAAAARRTQLAISVDIVWGFLSLHNDQWQSYRLLLQSSHMVRNAVLSPTWACNAGLSPCTVHLNEGLNLQALPAEIAGLLVTQTYEIKTTEEILP